MNNEEWERKMEFIVNQQAQFTVDIQKLQEVQAATEHKAAHAVEAAAHASETVARTAETVKNHSGLVLEGFRVVAERFKDTDVKINALIDSQMLTQEKLRDLDRRTGNRGNGAP